MVRRWIAAALLLCWSAGVYAQDASARREFALTETGRAVAEGRLGGLPTRDLTLDLSVPESPAFDVLGFTPQKIVRPTSPRDLAANLLNGVDERGNLQTGIAIDIAPVPIFLNDMADSPITLHDYRSDYLMRLASRTQLSLGTTKGTDSDDKAVRVGLGVKSTLWDAGDPRMDNRLAGCLFVAHQIVHAGMDLTLNASPEALKAIADALEASAPPARQAAYAAGGEDAAGIIMGEALAIRTEAGIGAPAIVSAQATVADDQATRIRTAIAPRLATVDVTLLEPEEANIVEVFTERFVDFSVVTLARGATLAAECMSTSKEQNWNQPSWEIGGAGSWISPDGKIDDLEDSGGAVWTSISLNLPDDSWWNLRQLDQAPRSLGRVSTFVRDHFQLILHARYRGDQKVPVQMDGMDTDATINQDSALAGGRLRIGVPNLAFSVEGAYVYTKQQGMSSNNSGFYSIGAEFRIAEDLWVQVSAGTETGGNPDGEQTTILSSIKYGFSSSSPFDTWRAVQATAQ